MPKRDTKRDGEMIYVLFAKNFESLRTCIICGNVRSDSELATQLRTEIKKSRLVFSKKVVEALSELTIDFAYSTIFMMDREEYKEIFDGINYESQKRKIYCDVIISQRYESVEEILGEYLDLPQ